MAQTLQLPENVYAAMHRYIELTAKMAEELTQTQKAAQEKAASDRKAAEATRKLAEETAARLLSHGHISAIEKDATIAQLLQPDNALMALSNILDRQKAAAAASPRPHRELGGPTKKGSANESNSGSGGGVPGVRPGYVGMPSGDRIQEYERRRAQGD